LIGDNIETAKAIAKECGIFNESIGIAMEGTAFRKLTPKQLDAALPNLQVLARSSPNDKHILVTRLNGL
jgi:magnesium-transporting ATPase (P-type)